MGNQLNEIKKYFRCFRCVKETNNPTSFHNLESNKNDNMELFFNHVITTCNDLKVSLVSLY